MTSMYFTDEKSVSYVLEQTLSNDVSVGDKASSLNGLFYINKDQHYIYQWLTPKFSEVVNALPQTYKGYMPFIMSPGCQQANIMRFSEFFEAKGADYNASFVKALEEENNCLALKRREAKSFSEFLSPYQHVLGK